MSTATSTKRTNTITKENISKAHAELFKKTGKEVKPVAIFAKIMDYPQLAHERHIERFCRLIVACVRKGLIDPLTIEKV